MSPCSPIALLCPQLEAKVGELSREKDDLESRVEEDQDEIEELLEKQRSHISQTTSLQSQLTEANMQVEELEDNKQTLEVKVGVDEFSIVVSTTFYSLSSRLA